MGSGKMEPLTDRFGRRHDYLRVSLTDRCNFRCVYCMPEEGAEWKPRDEVLSFEEIVRFVELFARLGVTKVRLTGGEPTVRKGYLNLVRSVASVEGIQHVALTTNGSTLAQDAQALTDAGLGSVNVSLDTLQEDRFRTITRTSGLARVMRGIDAALAAGLKTKINVVVLPGLNDDEAAAFVELTRDRLLDVRFIEFMPFLGNRWNPDRVVSSAEIRAELSKTYCLQPIDGSPSDVAREFKVDGHQGTVGFVSSVTESFCEGCNRIRLTVDGRIKTCLFLPPGCSLRDLLRSGTGVDEIADNIRTALMTKWAGHPPMNKWRQLDSLSMVQIGG